MMQGKLIEVINQANDRGEHFSTDELKAIRGLFQDGQKRIDVIKSISNNHSKIVTDTTTAFLPDHPELGSLGTTSESKYRRFAACLRDLEMILRYVTYAILAGDTAILQDKCLIGLKETYLALGIDPKLMALAVQEMKSIAIEIVSNQNNIISGDYTKLISEIAEYFDYIVAEIGGADPNEFANGAIITLTAKVDEIETTQPEIVISSNDLPVDRVARHYPLRGMPITIAPDFDEPMPELWEALAE